MKHAAQKQNALVMAVACAATLLQVGCSTLSVPMSPSTSNPSEATARFESVWFDGDGHGQWRFPWGFLAFEAKGTLLLFRDRLEFRRSDGTGFEMRNIRSVTLKNLRMTLADPNQWVAVSYGSSPNTKEVYFLDGSSLGWGGATGGTQKMLDAIRSRYSR